VADLSVVDQTARGELRRFLLEPHPVRGHWVSLRDAWQQLRTVHPYPPAVETLLGETVTAAVLLAATLKFDGKLTLQLAGHGRVPLLVAQCTHDFQIRAVAQHDAETPPLADFADLVGDGRLTVTVEAGGAGARYQGIVPINTSGVAASIEDYFSSSEQLPTRLRLHVQGGEAVGMLLQKLPTPDAEAAGAVIHSAWEQLQENLAAFSDGDLHQPVELLLQRLCGSYDCRLFGANAIRFRCGCNLQRVSSVLQSLGLDELRGVLAEQGSVTVTCEFCRRPYRFDPIDVEQLFAPNAAPDATQRLN
jgi:molecular chaperone Hsp33